MSSEIWITPSEAASLCNLSKRMIQINCKKGLYQTKSVIDNGGRQYRILLASLPAEAQVKYFDNSLTPYKDEEHTEIFDLAALPEYDREVWVKRKTILCASDGFLGDELEPWVQAWNAEHPEFKTSRTGVYEIRSLYKKYGDHGLAGKYGKRAGQFSTPDDLFELYKSKYLDENKRTPENCYQIVKGIALQQGRDIPGIAAFKYRMDREVPESAQDLKREGYQYWNRKWNNYIDRNYSNIQAGEFWISDHHQMDTGVKLENGKIVFPWVTAWRCFKTGKWLGWDMHPEAPNTEHILQAFYNAAIQYGIPCGILIDNGKDYRSKTFAGGRRNQRVQINEKEVRSLTAMMNIEVKFATPYGAQSKSIERDFRIVKERFSRQFECYRGGNVLERPESLTDVITTGKVIGFEEYKKLFNQFINDFLNNVSSNGKVLKGRSRNQAWADDLAVNNVLRKVIPDDLRLFCMRASGDVSVGRNGICYSQKNGMYYYATWMEGWKDRSRKLYMRRAPERYQEAWVFDARTNEYIGKAHLNVYSANAWAEGVHKEQLERVINQKKSVEKINKILGAANPDIITSAADDLELQQFVVAEQNKNIILPTSKDSKNYFMSKITEAVRREKLRTGTDDLDLKPLNKRSDENELAGWEE